MDNQDAPQVQPQTVNPPVVPTEPSPPQAPKKKNTGLIIGLIIAAVVFVMFAIGMVVASLVLSSQASKTAKDYRSAVTKQIDNILAADSASDVSNAANQKLQLQSVPFGSTFSSEYGDMSALADDYEKTRQVAADYAGDYTLYDSFKTDVGSIIDENETVAGDSADYATTMSELALAYENVADIYSETADTIGALNAPADVDSDKTDIVMSYRKLAIYAQDLADAVRSSDETAYQDALDGIDTVTAQVNDIQASLNQYESELTTRGKQVKSDIETFRDRLN